MVLSGDVCSSCEGGEMKTVEEIVVDRNGRKGEKIRYGANIDEFVVMWEGVKNGRKE